MEFCEHNLENGLEIIAERNASAYSCAVACFVRTGARDEDESLSGVSHFLEHMAFKGTPRRSAADVNRELDEIGAHANAFTSEEQTVYYVSVLPEYQDRAVDLLADIMRPSLRNEDFETEKQVILEEIAKYEDQPPFGAHEKSMAVHFGHHPLAQSVLGSLETVGELTVEQMRAYFTDRYRPNNMTLAATGNVDFDRLVGLVRDRCGDWQPGRIVRHTPRARPSTELRVFPNDLATMQYVIQTANGPAAEDEDRYAARLLSTVVGDESGSRFFWELVDTGLADYAVMFANEFQGTGVISTILCCAPEETAHNLHKTLMILCDVQDNGVQREELERAKNKICSHVVLQGERPLNRLFSLGNAWLQRQEYQSVAQAVERYRSVTGAQVDAVMQKYPLTVHSTVAVGPLRELARPE